MMEKSSEAPLLARAIIPSMACVALLGMGVRSDRPPSDAHGCALTISALQDASRPSQEVHDALKQVVDIYNVTHPDGLVPDKDGTYSSTVRLDLPASDTEIQLSITAKNRYPGMEQSQQFPDNVTKIATAVVNTKTNVPYATQTAELKDSAWKYSGSYLTESNSLYGAYQMTSVVTSGGLYACISRETYTQSSAKDVVLTGTSNVAKKSPEISQQATGIILSQLLVFGGAHQHFNAGIMDYSFPVQNVAFIRDFGITPRGLMMPPESP